MPNVIDLHAKDRWEAIDELVGHLIVTNKISSEHRDLIAALEQGSARHAPHKKPPPPNFPLNWV
jgi:hypothetical protein